MTFPQFDNDPRYRRKLDEVSRRIKVGLDEVKGWPLRTPAKAVLSHSSAMVFAAQSTIEEDKGPWHHVVLLGEGQTRLNMMTMTGGDTREERQESKYAVWTRTAQLFNLLDADVMIWLQDAWYTAITDEQFESGEWDWPSDCPLSKEALFLNIITPTQQALLSCPYGRRDDGTIHWSDFKKARSLGGGFEDVMLGQMVQEYRYLKPVAARDGQRRLSAIASSIVTPQRILAELTEMGQHVAFVDERFLRLN